MRRRRIILCAVYALMLSFALCLTNMAPAFADTGLETSSSVDNQDFNLILLIDRSGSMKTTDRSRLVQDAAKLFVDLCDEGRDSHIAVMSFDTEVENSGFIPLSDETQREQLKGYIDDISYDDGGTDIGLALLRAVDYILEESAPSRKKLIVLFTDGYTQDLIDKTEESSELQLREAIEKACENDCVIFTVGTNYNGSMKEHGRVALEGLRDYQIASGATNAPEDLLTIIDAMDQDGMKAVAAEFEKIYATIGNRIIHEGNLTIESPCIAEANIIISAPDGVSEVVLTAPSGNEAEIPLDGSEMELDGARIVFKAGKAYQLVKIIEPIPTGTWLLHVADEQHEPILNYTWMLTTKAEIKLTLKQKTEHSVLLIVEPENIEAKNIPDFLASLTEKTVLVKKTGDEGNGIEYELNAADGASALTVSIPVEPACGYEVSVHISDGYFIRNCAGSIETPNTWVPLEEEGSSFGTIYVWNWFTNSFDLSDLVRVDVQGCESVAGGDQLAKFELSGTTLKVHTLSAGSEKIRVESVLNNGNRIELTGNLKVLNPIYPIIGAGLLLLALVALIVKKSQKRVLRGTYFQQFNVCLEDEAQYTLPEVQIPHCKEFTLYDLLRSYYHDLMVPNWAKILDQKVLNKRSPYYREMKKIKFHVCRDEQSFMIGNSMHRRHKTQYDWSSEDESLSVSFRY